MRLRTMALIATLVAVPMSASVAHATDPPPSVNEVMEYDNATQDLPAPVTGASTMEMTIFVDLSPAMAGDALSRASPASIILGDNADPSSAVFTALDHVYETTAMLYPALMTSSGDLLPSTGARVMDPEGRCRRFVDIPSDLMMT